MATDCYGIITTDSLLLETAANQAGESA